MDKKILVTYATKYGATKEIAEKIGAVLSQAGLTADVLPVEGVRDLAAYRGVILGSAVYIGKWQKEAAAFLQANEKALAGQPVWIFSSGPSGEGDPAKLVEGWRLPGDVQAVADRIRPRDVTVFHGNIDLQKINFMEKFAVKNVVKKPFGDYRDWNMIAAWAGRVAAELKQSN